MNSIKECIEKIGDIHRKFDKEGCFDCPFCLDCGDGDCYVNDIFLYLVYSQQYIERTNYIGRINNRRINNLIIEGVENENA